jgi:hypothetical protein
MEVCVDVEGEYETDVVIDPNILTDKQKKELINAIKKGKSYTLKDYPIHICGEFYQDIDFEPMYNEGYY